MRLKLPMLAGATLLALFAAGCKKAQEPTPVQTNLTEPAKPAPPPPAPKPKPAETPKPEAPKVAPPPEVPADQQMLDDADATGMTARIDRDSEADGNSGGPQ